MLTYRTFSRYSSPAAYGGWHNNVTVLWNFPLCFCFLLPVVSLSDCVGSAPSVTQAWYSAVWGVYFLPRPRAPFWLMASWHRRAKACVCVCFSSCLRGPLTSSVFVWARCVKARRLTASPRPQWFHGAQRNKDIRCRDKTPHLRVCSVMLCLEFAV